MDHLRQAVRTVHLRKNITMTDDHLEKLMEWKVDGGTAHHAKEKVGPGFRKDEMWEAITTLETALAEREGERDRIRDAAKLARYYLKEYTLDSDGATHAKRVISNMIHALTPAPKPEGEEKTDG